MATDLDPMYRPPEELRSEVRKVSDFLLNALRLSARHLDWAIGVHGSMERDLDLIATPWSEQSADCETLIAALQAAAAEAIQGDCYISAYADRPHGRVSYTLHLVSDMLVHSSAGAHPYIDLSVFDARLLTPA
jgi:hypothetical protein